MYDVPNAVEALIETDKETLNGGESERIKEFC